MSFRQLTAIATLIGLALAIPASVWVARQDTELRSAAYFEKPDPPAGQSGKTYGLPSEGEPRIKLVWPFLGKVGDTVLIEGENFGDNPLDKALKFGKNLVPEEKILRWTPALIEFKIPASPPGTLSETISLSVAGKVAVWDYPFTVYELTTQAQVSEDQDIVTVSGAPGDATLEIFFEDGGRQTARVDAPIEVPPTSILSLKLVGSSGQPLPFFVEPAEFGF